MAFWAFVLFVVCSMQYALQSCNTSRSCSKCYKSAAGLFFSRFLKLCYASFVLCLWLSIHLGVLKIPCNPPAHVPLSMCTLHTRRHEVRAYAQSASPPDIASIEFSLSRIRGVLMCTWPQWLSPGWEYMKTGLRDVSWDCHPPHVQGVSISLTGNQSPGIFEFSKTSQIRTQIPL